MAFEDEVNQRLAAKRSEEEAERASASQVSARLALRVEEARAELREAARLLSERGVPTFVAWSDKETKSRVLRSDTTQPAGQRFGQCWVLRGATGSFYPWLLTTDGELLKSHPADITYLSDGWCTGNRDGWHFDLADDGTLWVSTPSVEGRHGPIGGGGFELGPFLVASVAQLLEP